MLESQTNKGFGGYVQTPCPDIFYREGRKEASFSVEEASTSGDRSDLGNPRHQQSTYQIIQCLKINFKY